MSNNIVSPLSPLLIEEKNISLAWGKAVLHILDHSGCEISPLIISINEFGQNNTVPENTQIREQLDSLLREKKFNDCENVAFTIFPQRIWQIARGNRQLLWKLYNYSYSSYKERRPRDNKRGLYFQRLIDYGCKTACGGNQLEWILSQYEKRSAVRRSMFQASIFDPARDHVGNAQLQFPCMQHVSFVPTEKGLIINAFYATQQLFVKAYGNYLGIAQLGQFMAHQMQTNLLKMNITIGVAKLEKITKNEFKAHSLYSIIQDNLGITK